MNILITGIHGFVGTNLVAALRQSHTLYGLDIVAPVKEGVVHTYSWSDMDNRTLPSVEAIVHLAGKAHDTRNKSEAQVYFDVNTVLTQKIFDYFLQSSAKKFIFFSSVKAAADVVTGDVLRENVVPAPQGPYGESKIAAENYILNHLPKDKDVYILRPAMIHGPGNKGNLNLLYSVVKKGLPYPLGAFENRRSFTSIDNLTFAVEHLLGLNIPTGIYNMADDDTLSTNELIRLMARTMNKKERLWYWSPSLIRVIAKIGTKVHFPLNTERLRKLTENYVVSNEKIKNAIGIKAFPVRAKDGFYKTIKSFESR